MSIEINRKKSKSFWLTFFYRLHKLLPISKKAKFRLFLQWEWIFDRLAHEASFQNYSEKDHPFRIYFYKFILNYLPKDSIILDLGCKQGDIAAGLAVSAKKVVGVDHDKVAIKEAHKKYQAANLEFIHEDAFNYLDQTNLKFDVLILSHLLEHLDDRKSFLEKLKKHFKYVYIEVPDFDKTYLNHYRKDIGEKLIYTDNDHVIEFGREDLHQLLMECKINIVASEYRFGIQRLWCEIKG